MLVPLEQEEEGPANQKRPLNAAMIPEKQLGAQEDDAFSPYRITDDMGNTSELSRSHCYTNFVIDNRIFLYTCKDNKNAVIPCVLYGYSAELLKISEHVAQGHSDIRFPAFQTFSQY